VIVLVDADVLLDVALDLRPHVGQSTDLLDSLERSSAAGFIAWHTVSNFYYLSVVRRGRPAARQFVTELLAFINVAPTSTEDMRYAARLAMRDLEDAMQVAAARACKADVIATRNVKDFHGSPIPAMKPADIVSQLPTG